MSSEDTFPSSAIVIVEDDSKIQEQFDFFKALAGKPNRAILLANYAMIETDTTSVRIIPKKNITRGLKADVLYNMTEEKDIINEVPFYSITCNKPAKYA